MSDTAPSKKTLGFFGRMSRLDRWSLIATAVLAIVYVSFALSPSSYGLVLEKIMATDAGLVAGHPQILRSDEFAVLTPFTQAAVRNGFKRVNETSFYREDMRSLYPLPIRDWGMFFKPLMWPYLLVPPAYAFSFYYFGLMVLFVFGYALLFRALGIRPPHALLLSTILFCTGFTQYWWTMFAPTLAWFPWLVVAATSRIDRRLKFLLLAYLGACWVIGLFYPPLLYSLGVVALLLALTLLRERFQKLSDFLWPASGLVAGALVAAFYLRDYLAANLHTVYPGLRTVGGGLDYRIWLSQFFPLLTSVNHGSLLSSPANMCEAAMVGTFYVLPALFFLDYAKLKPPKVVGLPSPDCAPCPSHSPSCPPGCCCRCPHGSARRCCSIGFLRNALLSHLGLRFY